MSEKMKMLEIHLEPNALKGREEKLENLVLKADRDSNKIDNKDVEQAIEAFAKSESSTLGYAAAGFVPVLLLLNSLPFLRGLDDLLVDIFAAFATMILGISGMYFALYKAFFIGPRRIFMEGYRMGLVKKYRFFIFPRGVCAKVNLIAMFCIPIGYLIVVTLMLRVLFS